MEEVGSKNKLLADPGGVRGSLKSPPRNIVLKYLIKKEIIWSQRDQIISFS